MPRNYTGRDLERERAVRWGRRENIVARIEGDIGNHVQLPFEHSCKTCAYYDGRCFLPRSVDFPNGNARGSCAYCVGQNCSFIKAPNSSRRLLQAWLDDATAHSVKHDNPDPTSGEQKQIIDLNAEPATAITQSSKDAAATDAISTSTSTTSIPVLSAQPIRPPATFPSSFSLSSSNSSQSVPEAEDNSTPSNSKRSRSDSGLDTSDITPAKAPRLRSTHTANTTSDEVLLGSLQDTHFRDLLLGLARQHETVLKSRNDATTTNEEHKATFKKSEALIKVLQDQKVDLENDKSALVLEKDTAAMLTCEEATVANKKHILQITKAEGLIKSLEDQKAEWEKERARLLMNVAAMLNREKTLDFKNRYANLEVKNADAEALLRTTQSLLKEADLAKIASETELQRVKDDRSAEGTVKVQKEIEDKVLWEKMEEKREGMRSMIEKLESQMREKDKDMDAMKDEARIKMKELGDQLVDMQKDKKTMSITMRGLEVRLDEMENLRNKNISAVQRANACRDERNQAQASLAIAQGEKIQASTKLGHTQTALDAAAATIRKLQQDKNQLLQKESSMQVMVKPKLANLQANHHQVETDKKRLEAEIQQAKQRIAELETSLQISDASQADHISVEKELVASKILAPNYMEQRDKARKDLVKSDEAKTDLRRNWNLKSAEMSRLHAEIRRLKGEKPRISEGTRDDSGSIGEVEGLIDMSMED